MSAFKKGSLVRIPRKPDKYLEYPVWVDKMDEMIGGTFEVGEEADSQGVLRVYNHDKSGWWAFKTHWVEPVEENMKEFKDIKVGDKAWSYQLGDCECVDVDDGRYYPIKLRNREGSCETYSYEARAVSADKYPTAFLTKPAHIKDEPPQIAVDTKMIVWVDGSSEKHKRYFSHWQNGRVACFDSGATSFSTDRNKTSTWENYEIVE